MRTSSAVTVQCTVCSDFCHLCAVSGRRAWVEGSLISHAHVQCTLSSVDRETECMEVTRSCLMTSCDRQSPRHEYNTNRNCVPSEPERGVVTRVVARPSRCPSRLGSCYAFGIAIGEGQAQGGTTRLRLDTRQYRRLFALGIGTAVGSVGTVHCTQQHHHVA